MQIYAIRFSNYKFDLKNLEKISKFLAANSRFEYVVKDESAPEITNCLTAVRYIYKAVTNIEIPRVWIGDLPRFLITQYGCSLVKVKISELKPGDLLFLRRDVTNVIDKNIRYIRHIMIVINASLVFHSSAARGNGYIENFVAPLDHYAFKLPARVIVDPALFMRYIDPRNTALQLLYNDSLISFPVPRPIYKNLKVLSSQPEKDYKNKSGAVIPDIRPSIKLKCLS